MTDKKVIHILIFSFAVLMVLLRPYAAYRITTHADFANNPAKANSVLQRLINKKDDHHTAEVSQFTQVQHSKITPALPVMLTLFFHKPVSLPIVGLKHYVRGNTVFRICPENSYYKQLSKFQV